MAPDLPPEVWSIIAEHMETPQEWAKACGTCHTSFGVHLARFGAIPMSFRELCWFAKRWQSATAVGLDLSYCVSDCFGRLWPDSPQADQWCAELDAIIAASRAGSFGNLSQLGVTLGMSQPFKWITAVLSRAINLQLLQLKTLKPQILPQMRHLKHLVLCFSHGQGMPKNFCTPLDCLRTLYLGTYSLPGDTGDLHLPALYLHRCLHLQAVSFENMLPGDLTVPDGCTVSMASDIKTCLKVPAIWHQATSARFSAAEHDGHLVTSFFSHVHQNLTCLEIHTTATTSLMDFAAAFPKLKHLSVTSVHGDCVMIVPTTLTSFELATDASPLFKLQTSKPWQKACVRSDWLGAAGNASWIC